MRFQNNAQAQLYDWLKSPEAASILNLSFNIFRKLLIQTVPDILTDCVQGRHMHFTVEDCMLLSALTKTDSQFR